MSTPDSQERDFSPQPPRVEPPQPPTSLPPQPPSIPQLQQPGGSQSAPLQRVPQQNVVPPHLAAVQQTPATPLTTPTAAAPPSVPQVPVTPVIPTPPVPTQPVPAQPTAQPPASVAQTPAVPQPTAQQIAAAAPAMAGPEHPSSELDSEVEETEGGLRETIEVVAAQVLDFIKRVAAPSAPPWMVSMLVHLLILVVLALIALPEIVESTFVVEVSYAEENGEQLLDDTQFLESIEPLEAESALAFDARNVENPLASSAMPQIKLDLFEPASEMKTPTIGLALSGREKGAKRALLAAYGGTNVTESAVDLALAWLKRNQRSDGTWSLNGPYKDGVSGTENNLAATAMALLAFQGAGNTHKSGDYQANVQKGMEALLKMQDREGSFFATQRLPSSHQLYSQAQATIVICELFGMTQDETLREPAQRALNYAESIQAEDGHGGGGWRYQPGDQVDMSVTGWFVIALKSGEMARLSVPSPVKEKVRRFLDNAVAIPRESEQFVEGSRYLYRIGEKDQRVSMTAEALLCRQYLGWQHNDPRLLAGVDHLNDHPIDWNEPNIYYWYYATQVMHHMGGDSWDQWNNVMRKALPSAQTKTGRERGSWSPAGDKFGYTGGRLFMTCLCTYMLEVYYRHMPIYQH